MKQKIKQIIAREGLIILSLILLAGLSGYVASSLDSKKYEYTSNAQEVEIAKIGKPLKVKTSNPTQGGQDIVSTAPMTYEEVLKAGGVDITAQAQPEVSISQTRKRPSLDEIYGASGNQPASLQEPVSQKIDLSSGDWEDYTPPSQSVQQNKKMSLGGDEWFELIPQGVIVLFPKETSKSVIEKTIRRDFSYIDKVDFITYNKPQYKSIDRYYDAKGNRKFDSFIYRINFWIIALIVVLAVYPSYLLIRFVVWSIKTLKNRTGENEQ